MGLEEGSGEGEDKPCEDGECNEIPTGCASSRYGCCEDGETSAQGPNYFRCPGTEESVGGCAGNNNNNIFYSYSAIKFKSNR